MTNTENNRSSALYKLYTEDVTGLLRLISKADLQGATIQYGFGAYGTHTENAAVIEIIAPDNRQTDERIAALATEIATVNNQAYVLVAKLPITQLTRFGGANALPGRD